MIHTYEDAATAVRIEHRNDWTGKITITVPDDDGVDQQVTFPAKVLRDFVMVEFGGKFRSAIEKTLSELFADAPVMLDLPEDEDPEGAEAVVVARDRERKTFV